MLKPSTPRDSPLLQLAEAAGLVPQWRDVHGRVQQVNESTLRRMLQIMGLRCNTLPRINESLRQLSVQSEDIAHTMVVTSMDEDAVVSYSGPMRYEITLQDGERRTGMAHPIGPRKAVIPAIGRVGYHRLVIGSTALTLAVAPQKCPSVADLTGEAVRAWGVAAQVYSLRHTAWQGWAVGGDFSALATLGQGAAREGACAIAISPVHAMFAADPLRCSPYSPSSRLFLNVAYIEPSLVLGRDAVQHALADLGPFDVPNAAMPRDPGRIDWQKLLPARLKLLRRLFDSFDTQGPSRLVDEFRSFCGRQGPSLESHCRYEAMHAYYAPTIGAASGWQDWPADVRDCNGPGVQRFADSHGVDIRFHAFLQWLAHEGMQFAQRSAREAGMPVGLITDLAIGTDPRGSHAWSRQGEMLAGVSVGAAPDLYQPHGQNWGLTAFSPVALRQRAYDPFIETLRAALTHAGGVRIDHILGLGRMWLIPQGADAAEGVYLRYPLDDMLRLIALEASQHRAIVIGENLGTVPEGFNDKLRQRGIMGTSVLWFQREPDARQPPPTVPPFIEPARWPPLSTATPTTHDLPTINGWWAGRDLQWRERLGQLSAAGMAEQAAVRACDRKALWLALRDARCVSGLSSDIPDPAPRDAILAFVARTPSPLFIVSMEDLAGQLDQPNLPGSSGCGIGSHPNWSQSLPVGVEKIFSDPEVARGVAAVVGARRPS